MQFNLLVDPGSTTDFAIVSTKVSSLTGGLGNISAIHVNHQDPDVGSSTPLIIARHAPKAAVITSEDTWRLICHFGLPRERVVLTDKYAKGLKLPTGHVVLPVPSPYCHFRGAVMLYDPETRVLFSGDLFGGLSEKSMTGLWAEEGDWKGIRAFHQIYMPTNRALARTVAAIRNLKPAVEIIAPQHGRVIRGELVADFLDRMEHLQVGMDILDEDAESIGGWNHVLDRVIDTARMFLGSAVEVRLAEEKAIHDTISFEGPQPRITMSGRWTIERVLEALTHGEPPSVANPIKMESITAASDLQLPTPHVILEEDSQDIVGQMEILSA